MMEPTDNIEIEWDDDEPPYDPEKAARIVYRCEQCGKFYSMRTSEPHRLCFKMQAARDAGYASVFSMWDA